MARPKHYQRTLEEALAGVPARTYNVNRTQEAVVDENGRRLRSSAQSKRRNKRKDPRDCWFVWATDPTHPKYTPELAKKHFLGLAKGARAGAKTRRSMPKGYRAREWKPLFEKRVEKAMAVIELAQDIFDLPEGEQEKAIAKEALAFELALMRSEEHTVKTRHAAAKTLLDFTKSKPASKLDVAVSTAEELLGKVADKNGL